MTDLVSQFRKDWCEQRGHASALREAQYKSAATIENSAIVVTNDLVYSFEVDQIHPRRKQEVGKRLANLALNRNYGFTNIACYSSEAIEAFVPEGASSEIYVKLSNCPNGTDISRKPSQC